MKRIICFGQIFALVFLSACSSSPSSSTGNVASEISVISSTSFVEKDVLPFPEVEIPAAPDLGSDPYGRMTVPIELEYEITCPSEDFLDALEELDDESYRKLQDKENYFSIKEYQLFFYDLAGLFGPSKICIVDPNNIVQEIFYSTQPIRQIRFVPDKREIYVELLSIVYPEGYTGDTYRLDFLHEKLWPTDYEEIHLADLNGYVLYNNQQYCWYSDFETGLRTLFKGGRILEGEIIAENIKTDPVFADGKAYYLRPDDGILYYRDLQEDTYTHEMKTSISLMKPGWRFLIYENIIVYEDKEFKVFMADVNMEKTITTLPISSTDNIINFSQNGLYFHSTNDDLVFCDFEGNTTVLFTDVTEVLIKAVLGEWAYFSIRQLNSNGATSYGRVRLDGTDLVYFS